MPLTKREQNSKNWKELKEISNGEHKSRWNQKRRHILIAVELAKYRTFRELQQLSNNYNYSTIDTPLPQMRNELKIFNMVNEFRPDSKEREIKYNMDVKEAENIILENVNKKFPSEISGGMKKRVSIARAIVNNPKYLFCDEPNSGLDPQTSILIDALIKEITYEYNMTTIVITHDMNSVIEILRYFPIFTPLFLREKK